MTRRRALPALLAALLACSLASAVQAGSACSEHRLTVEDFRQADALARVVRDALERDVHEAAILARAGADLSRYGLRFSHAALVMRAPAGTPWRVVHLLNHCGSGAGALYREGLINFFLDDPFEYRALLLIPHRPLQRRLRDAATGEAARAVFEPRYDMLAHPRSLRAQNSNQWLAELLAVAQAGPGRIADRTAAQDWLHAHGFRADVLRLSAMERLGARLFRANVRFEDQPAQERAAGRIHAVTVDALVRYLRGSEPGLTMRVLEPPAAGPMPD